jgi:hypothetical protein
MPDSSAVSIISQPEGNDRYVSSQRDELTLYEPALQNGVTGLLAHNYLAGAQFYELTVGQILWVFYTPHKAQAYEITTATSYQRLRQPESSDTYVRLDNQQELSTAAVFGEYYSGDHRLVLQTCLEKEGDRSWGLFFVVAKPWQH